MSWVITVTIKTLQILKSKSYANFKKQGSTFTYPPVHIRSTKMINLKFTNFNNTYVYTFKSQIPDLRPECSSLTVSIKIIQKFKEEIVLTLKIAFYTCN
jgi:hypothetical protein